MMFASRKINRDPMRWYCEECDMRHAELDFCEHDVIEHDPRPEFDNNPNPVLVAFRERWEASGGSIGLADASRLRRLSVHFLTRINGEFYTQRGVSRAHIDHARRVLQRLANMQEEN